MDAVSVQPGSSAPPQSGQHSASTATEIVSPFSPTGSSRRRNTPSPALRPGGFGFSFPAPLENGAAERPCLRRNSSICRCSSLISAINSAGLNDSKSAKQQNEPFLFHAPDHLN